jgi:hypothetical protein
MYYCSIIFSESEVQNLKKLSNANPWAAYFIGISPNQPAKIDDRWKDQIDIDKENLNIFFNGIDENSDLYYKLISLYNQEDKPKTNMIDVAQAFQQLTGFIYNPTYQE